MNMVKAIVAFAQEVYIQSHAQGNITIILGEDSFTLLERELLNRVNADTTNESVSRSLGVEIFTPFNSSVRVKVAEELRD